MLSLRRASAALLAAVPIAACVADPSAEDLGSIGDGKSDTGGITNKFFQIGAGETREFTFAAAGPFAIHATQPGAAADARAPMHVEVSADGVQTQESASEGEPSLAVTFEGEGERTYRLAITNDGSITIKGVLDVVPTVGLPDPNAAQPPPVEWLPPPLETWPPAYVIFNNTGCGHDCTKEDQTALKARSVMAKMVIEAIHNVREGGTIRVANFNISSSSTVAPVADALLWAMNERHARVRIVMDPGQNGPDSRTTLFAQQGAEVVFTAGLTYQSDFEPGVDKLGIMHSKMVIVDDQVLLTGSNNFSSTGFVTNEENSVVLRAPEHADRIAAFTCDFEHAFSAGVPPGAAPVGDDDPVRHQAVVELEDCNLEDAWFPPGGAFDDRAPAYEALRDSIFRARRSIYLAPDMFAHPGLVNAIVDRARRAKEFGDQFRVEVVMDASSEALGNPAFGECLSDIAAAEGLDIRVRYWPGTEEIFQLLHHKFLIVDAEDPQRAALYNGSANFSAKALKWSFENVARYRGDEFPVVVGAFRVRFHKLFEQAMTKEDLAAEGIEVPACPLDVSSI